MPFAGPTPVTTSASPSRLPRRRPSPRKLSPAPPLENLHLLGVGQCQCAVDYWFNNNAQRPPRCAWRSSCCIVSPSSGRNRTRRSGLRRQRPLHYTTPDSPSPPSGRQTAPTSAFRLLDGFRRPSATPCDGPDRASRPIAPGTTGFCRRRRHLQFVDSRYPDKCWSLPHNPAGWPAWPAGGRYPRLLLQGRHFLTSRAAIPFRRGRKVAQNSGDASAVWTHLLNNCCGSRCSPAPSCSTTSSALPFLRLRNSGHGSARGWAWVGPVKRRKPRTRLQTISPTTWAAVPGTSSIERQSSATIRSLLASPPTHRPAAVVVDPAPTVRQTASINHLTRGSCDHGDIHGPDEHHSPQ